ncbi:MAG: thiamine-phosphate kinase [Verrucomicrobiota bacterium]|nr:thiamine-phosphate kinase [Verrucomicrobiota bacterium]
MNLRQIGEDRLLARLLPHLGGGKNVLAGAGDDCAVVESPSAGQLLLLKTDCVVEGIHFSASDDAAAVGWKAMMRPLSDFAAMSGVPQFALITLIAPAAKKVAWTTKLYRGLEKAARKFGVTIVGGETSATRGPAVISVSVAGFVEKDRWISRSGGRANDDLFVTGRLGGSFHRKHLRFTPRIAESRWLTKNFSVHAMIDLSDGLGVDLPRLAQASHLGFEIDESALPRNRGCTIQQAINDGEDFELLFAIAPRVSGRLQASWQKKFPKLLVTRIGRLNRTSKIKHRKWHGYVHFE